MMMLHDALPKGVRWGPWSGAGDVISPFVPAQAGTQEPRLSHRVSLGPACAGTTVMRSYADLRIGAKPSGSHRAAAVCARPSSRALVE